MRAADDESEGAGAEVEPPPPVHAPRTSAYPSERARTDERADTGTGCFEFMASALPLSDHGVCVKSNTSHRSAMAGMLVGTYASAATVGFGRLSRLRFDTG